MDAQLSSVDSGYAKRRKEHLGLINQLRAIGAQADLDLPRIAVIGNQSAGKSSLVEAISGINVPRDAGTCTRCPMECRLSSSTGAWQCQVSIRWEFNEDGSPCDEVQEVQFGGVITQKSEVELALRRAQTAVLNPQIDPKKYALMTSAELKVNSQNKLKFSRNVVCIDLYGPELTDLAFVDLPGIIQNAETETVQLVEDLVRSHIKGNCLILVTVPMSDDIENQKAVQLAKQEDPSGLRTIGVMTKPDTLTAGATKARDLWLDVIEGRRFPLRHGYYCTRQPDDDERTNGVSSEQARKAEQDFFAKTSPWSRSAHQQRFGTRNLISNLSKLLSQIIDDALPKLQGQVTEHLTSCVTRLSALPPAVTTEASAHVLSMVTSFCTDVQLLVQGDSQNAALVQENRRTYATYKRDIRETAPRFVPYPNAKEASSNEDGWLDLDDDEVEDGGLQSSGFVYLDDVHRLWMRELPNNVPYSAKIALIRRTQDSWGLDSHKCFDTVHKALEKTVSRLVNTHFHRYENLKSRLMHNVMDLLRTKHGETWERIQSLLQLESVPYTQNGHYLQVTKDKYLSKYKDARAGKVLFSEPPPKKRKTSVVPTNSSTSEKPANSTSMFSFGGTTVSAATSAFGQSSLTQSSPVPPSVQDQKRKATPRTPQGTSLFTTASEFGTPAQASDSASGALTFSAHSSAAAPSIPRPTQTTNAPQKRPLLDEDEREQIENEALALLARLGYTHATAADLGKLIPPDIYEQEMDVMAEVRAYFHVSYKRVIDNIPMTIDHMFLFAFAQALQPYLIERLGLGSASGAARCEGYLAEDPNVVAEREELSARRKRLESVQTELFNFGL